MSNWLDGRPAFILPDFTLLVDPSPAEWREILGHDMPPAMGAAENFTEEGLTYILNIFPNQDVAGAATLYLGTFTAQSASTVPPTTQVLGTAPPVSGVTEPTAGTGGYARTAIANTLWVNPAVSSGVEVSTGATPVSFTESAAAWSPTSQNGFFITQQLAQGSGSIGIGYANFNDTTAASVNAAGIVLRITPTWHYNY